MVELRIAMVLIAARRSIFTDKASILPEQSMDSPASAATELRSESPYPLEEQRQKIDYIIERTTGIPSVQSLSEILEEAQEEEYLEAVRDERNALFDQLYGMPPQDFDRYFSEIRQAVQNDVDRFCKPADANVFAQWIEKDAWLPAEALSLWLGLDPRFGPHLIAWAQRNRGLALAAVEILERWELITRATWVGALVDPLEPRMFANWAHDKRRLSGHFGAWFADATSEGSSVPIDKEFEAERTQLRAEVTRLSKKLTDLNQPHYKLAVKLFGALCAGMYGHKLGKRNKSTAIITEIVGMFIPSAPGERTVRKYIQKSIMELDKGDVEKLAAIYEEEAKVVGTPEPLDRNFPERRSGFRTRSS